MSGSDRNTPCVVVRDVIATCGNNDDDRTMTEGPKILLIEDEQDIRRFLRVSLVGHGYRLVESATGAMG